MTHVAKLFGAAIVLAMALPAAAAPRARNLGLEFDGVAGPLNAITDVAGVEVGHTTLSRGDAATGGAVVRTGVTAVLPRGRASTTPVFAAWNTANGAGEMTGTIWLDERGYLDGPILITNTHSVGVVRDAAVRWMIGKGWTAYWNAPVVAETYDGALSDMNGFHVTAADAITALDAARPGAVNEGNVGGGTGMICNQFKGGIGTASRVVKSGGSQYTVGVLVQCNYGDRAGLRIGPLAVGKATADRLLPCFTGAKPADGYYPACSAKDTTVQLRGDTPDGSIIVIVATDAPLLPHQLKRLAKRPTLGLGRLGAVAEDGSGDIFLAFSTANAAITALQFEKNVAVIQHPNDDLTPLFAGAVLATEEAIVNAMVAARTMIGRNGLKVEALPHDLVRRLARQSVSPARKP